MSEHGIHRLLRLALALALIVVGASSYLRLAGNGLGCEPWPACYGSTAAFEDAQRQVPVQALRMAHRVAASAFLLAALVIVALAWRTWRSGRRAAGLALLGITFLLALVGRFTPSTLPWITWVNVLGGFALIGLVLGLLRPARQEGAAPRTSTILLLAFLVAQVIGGTLISSRVAAAACDPACVNAPAGDTIALLHPLRPGSALDVTGQPGAATSLHAVHRLGGLVLALAALAWAARDAAGRRLVAVALATFVLLALGTASTHNAAAAVAAAHALAAALLLATVALALPTSRR